MQRDMQRRQRSASRQQPPPRRHAEQARPAAIDRLGEQGHVQTRRSGVPAGPGAGGQRAALRRSLASRAALRRAFVVAAIVGPPAALRFYDVEDDE